MPVYLYHAAPRAVADAIARTGLEARSTGGKEAQPYLCMSAIESGAATLQRKASDVIFRVKFTDLDASKWTARGAGLKEWRSSEGIPANLLEYRRSLGSDAQKMWRPITTFPTGL